jgi:hypothetical protein
MEYYMDRQLYYYVYIDFEAMSYHPYLVVNY